MNKLFTGVLVIILILAILYVIVAYKDMFYVSHECLRYGWDDSEARVSGNDYCIKSRDGDGVMIRRTLDWVKSHCNELGECTQ